MAIGKTSAGGADEARTGGDWVSEFYRDADQVDITKLGRWFADDIDLRFANNPKIDNKMDAIATLGAFFTSISAMRHVCENLLLDGEQAAQQAVVTYTTFSGEDISLPVSSYLRRDGKGLLNRLWIYIDLAPLFSPK
jgi:hypothetical protein